MLHPSHREGSVPPRMSSPSVGKKRQLWNHMVITIKQRSYREAEGRPVPWEVGE